MPNVVVIRRLIVGVLRGGNITPANQVMITENGIDFVTESGLQLFITE